MICQFKILCGFSFRLQDNPTASHLHDVRMTFASTRTIPMLNIFSLRRTFSDVAKI